MQQHPAKEKPLAGLDTRITVENVLSRTAWNTGLFVSATVMLLCFIMDTQNAIITKLSGARIRTTLLRVS